MGLFLHSDWQMVLGGFIPSGSSKKNTKLIRPKFIEKNETTMKKYTRLAGIFSFYLICTLSTAAASDECTDCGSVSGKVTVWKTNVKTSGAKSDKDVVVFLENTNGKTVPKGNRRVKMDQKSLIFIPHILPVQQGTTVTFLNSDTVEHNIFFLFEKTGETLDIGTWGQGISVDHTFTKSGVVITLCKLHLEMAAYTIVLDNPYYTGTAISEDSQEAAYEILNVPPGNYRLKAWHKKLKMKGTQAQITVESGKTTQSDITITKKKYAK